MFSEVGEIALVDARRGQFSAISENTRDINPSLIQNGLKSVFLGKKKNESESPQAMSPRRESIFPLICTMRKIQFLGK